MRLSRGGGGGSVLYALARQDSGWGWGAVQPSSEDLIRVLQNFDLVSVSPQPDPGVTEYLYSVEDFVRTLREPR